MRVIFMPKRDTALKGARTVTPKTMDDRVTLLKRKGAGNMADNTNTSQEQQASGQQEQNQSTNPVIDYDKIQQMLDGTLAAKEDTALKAYFKQQGLSQQEVEQAINAFKQQKAAQQPDVAGMQNQINEAQTQLTAAQKMTQQAQIESAATIAAVSLGVDAKTIPYVLKLADFSKAVGTDGSINADEVQAALNKVMEDVPALKPQEASGRGFRQIGTGGNPAQHTQQTNNNQSAVPTHRWNRWN
jgi:transcriptional regulator with XRE-family HTH domain|nr:MAG TPA: hypothetical protein [Caudoviricetes sp.]